jgi:hypothetical protein
VRTLQQRRYGTFTLQCRRRRRLQAAAETAGAKPAGPDSPRTWFAAARPEIIFEPTSLSLGMFCHKKFIRVFKMGTGCPFLKFGDVLSQN